MARALGLAVVLSLLGCAAEPAPLPAPPAAAPAVAVHAAPPAAPLASLSTAVAPLHAEIQSTLVEAATTVIEPKPPACETLLTPEGFDLIVRFEAGGRALYERRYQRPIWPGRVSGVTIGIGYDLGHAARPTILADWQPHPQRDELPAASGITGPAARPVALAMRHVITPYPLAEHVFSCTSVIAYWRKTRRAFGGTAFDALPPHARDALVSLVYNRGTGMKGDARAEMRAIRDQCVPARDVRCIATQIRAMKRVWRGTDIEAGMAARRDAEADLALIDAPPGDPPV